MTAEVQRLKIMWPNSKYKKYYAGEGIFFKKSIVTAIEKSIVTAIETSRDITPHDNRHRVTRRVKVIIDFFL